LARLHHRRDLTYRPVSDAPQSRVALSWREDTTTDHVEDFIGIVRGRTVNSTRGRTPTAAEPKKKADEGAARRKPPAGEPAAGRPAGRTSARPPRPAKRGKPRRRS